MSRKRAYVACAILPGHSASVMCLPEVRHAGPRSGGSIKHLVAHALELVVPHGLKDVADADHPSSTYSITIVQQDMQEAHIALDQHCHDAPGSKCRLKPIK